MNVGELKELLNRLPDDTPIILAADDEGNDFHWLYAYMVGRVGENVTHLSPDDIWNELDVLEAKKQGVEVPDDLVPVLVLWP